MQFTNYQDLGNGAYRFDSDDGASRTFTGPQAAELAQELDRMRLPESRLNAVGNQPGNAPALRNLEEQTGAQFTRSDPNFQQRIAQSEQQIAELDRQRGAMERKREPTFEEQMAKAARDIERLDQETRRANTPQRDDPTVGGAMGTIVSGMRDRDANERMERQESYGQAMQGAQRSVSEASARDRAQSAQNLTELESQTGARFTGQDQQQMTQAIERSRSNRIDMVNVLKTMMGEGAMTEDDIARFRAIMSKYETDRTYGGSGG